MNYKRRFALTKEYSLEIIDQLDEFKKFKSSWDEMASNLNSYFPFMCFDWFDVWLSHFLNTNSLFILIVYNKNEPVAIAPFLIIRDIFRGLKINKIELIGNAYSPFRYFLFRDLDKNRQEEILKQLFVFLFRVYKKWDIIDLYGIPEENSFFNYILTCVRKTGLKNSEYFAYADWYIDEIDYSGEEYLNRRSGNIRKNVPYRKRRLGKIGKLEFKMINKNEDIDSYMDIYYDLYSKSWQKREGVGPTFHRDLAKMSMQHDWLRLGFLYLDNAPMACQFWISANNYAYILKLFYDQDFRKHAPGKILTAEMMKYVIDKDQVSEIDFVSGDDSYKKVWTPKRRERKGLLIFNNNLRGKYLAFVTNKIRPAFNKIKLLRKIKEMIENY